MDTVLRQAVLADAHPVWLDAITKLLERCGFEVAARTTPGPEAISALEELHPDVLVTEVPSAADPLDGPAYVREARDRAPDTKILVLAAADDAQTVHEILLAGAEAYAVKTAAAEDIVAAVHQLFDGSVFMLPAQMLEDLPAPSHNGADPDPKLDSLTPRELEILRLVAEGLTNAQLARMLWLSEQTVKFHLSNIYRKLGVANRTEAGRWAEVHGALILDASPRVARSGA